ncbi:LysR family transcriptional regulator [Devosia sediminis]|uniref:LysR family transcriptional regulator n=1 Tax=Devosia sediminis TaxID=2798801 RepID=A0A934IZZ7_9HYPH|nr:LysR family transcriptional regulator [Devosia sediminis]MBJ3785300.1 LysR family transcriptional regulator [Devosia sediminis]
MTDRLAELEVLLAICDTGSLSAAARHLRRSPPTITRILADLEARVGAPLVERSSRRCQPTDAGRQLVEQSRNILIGYQEAVSEVAGRVADPRGKVRITAPLFFGRDHVAPHIGAFLDLYEGLSVELSLSDQLVDLQDDTADLAVRVGTIADQTLTRRVVGTVRRVNVASPEYLQAHGTPAHPEALAGHRLIEHARMGAATAWKFVEHGKPLSLDLPARFSVDHPDVALSAARSGQGIVTVLSYQAALDVAAGRLVHVLTDFEPEPLPVSLAWVGRKSRLRRIRIAIDFLAERLAQSLAEVPEGSTAAATALRG